MSYSTVILSDTPLGYLRQGESSGVAIADSSGNSRNGTLQPQSAGSWTGGTMGVSGAIVGDADTCLTFNGTDGRGVIPDNAAWDVTSGSVECWFKTSASGAYQQIVSRDDNNQGRNWFLRVTNTNKLEFLAFTGLVASPSTVNVVSSASVNDGAWHHAVGVWSYNGGGNTTSIELFLDGVSVGTNSVASSMPSTATAIDIGATDNSGTGYLFFFNGQIDEVAVYGTALSSACVTAHYDFGTGAGAATTYTVTGTTAGPVGAQSANFTVTLDGLPTGTEVITPSATGCTFTPSSLSFSGATTSLTFTINAAAAGTKTISFTSSTLDDPADVSYEAKLATTKVVTWDDGIAGNDNEVAVKNLDGTYFSGFDDAGVADQGNGVFSATVTVPADMSGIAIRHDIDLDTYYSRSLFPELRDMVTTTWAYANKTLTS